MEIPDLGYEPTIPEVLHRAVREWGDRDFVVTPDRRMTYAEAEERSRRLAKRMIAAGMGKGTRVGLYLTYGQEWVIAWLAASRIGALGDAARHHLPPGRDPQGAAHRRHRHAHHRPHRARP